MSAMASQITAASMVYSTICSGADQRKHQSSASLAFVRGILRGAVNSPQRASNAENVSIWWRHHVFELINTPYQRNLQICWPDLNIVSLTHWRIYVSVNYMLVKPPDVLPLLCFNVQTEMRFWVEQFLFPENMRCKNELFYSKSHFSLHVKAKQLRHIVWFHKHKITLKYV